MERQPSVKRDELLHEKNNDYERKHELFNFTKSVLDLEAEIGVPPNIPSSLIVNNNGTLQTNKLQGAEYKHKEHSNANLTMNKIVDNSLTIPLSVNEQETTIRELEDNWSIGQKHCIKAYESVDCSPVDNIQLSRVYFSQKNTDAECSQSFKQVSNQLDTYMTTKRNYEEHPSLLSPKRRQKVTFNDIVSKQYVTNTKRRTLSTSNKSTSNLKGLFQKSTKLSKDSVISANHYLYFLPQKRKLVETGYDRTRDGVADHMQDIYNSRTQGRTHSLPNTGFLQTHLDDDHYDDGDVEQEEEKVDEGVEPQMQVVLDSNGRVLVQNVLHTNTSSNNNSMRSYYTRCNANFDRDSMSIGHQIEHDSLSSSERDLGLPRRGEERGIGEGYHKSAFKAYKAHIGNGIYLEREAINTDTGKVERLNSYQPHNDSDEYCNKRQKLNYKLQDDMYQREFSELSNDFYPRNSSDIEEYHCDNAHLYRSEYYTNSTYNNQQGQDNYYRMKGLGSMYDVSLKENGEETTVKRKLPVRLLKATEYPTNNLYTAPHSSNKTHEEDDHEIARNALLAGQTIGNDTNYCRSSYMCTRESPGGAEALKRGSLADNEFKKSEETANNAYLVRQFVDAHGKPFIAVYSSYDYGADLHRAKEIERGQKQFTMKTTNASRRLATDNETPSNVYKTTGCNINTTHHSHASLQHNLQKNLSASPHIQISNTPYIDSKQTVVSSERAFQRFKGDSSSRKYFINRPLCRGQSSPCKQGDQRNQVETTHNTDQQPLGYYRDEGAVIDSDNDEIDDDEDGDRGELKHSQLKHRTAFNTKQVKSHAHHRQNASALNDDDIGVDVKHLRYKSGYYQTKTRTTTVGNGGNIDNKEENGVIGYQNEVKAYYHQQHEAAYSYDAYRKEHLMHKHSSTHAGNNVYKAEEGEDKTMHTYGGINKCLAADKMNEEEEIRDDLFITYPKNSNGQNETVNRHNYQITTPSLSPSINVNNDKNVNDEKDDLSYNCASVANTSNDPKHDKEENSIKYKANKDKKNSRDSRAPSTTSTNAANDDNDAPSTTSPNKVTGEKEEQKYKCEWPACSKSFRHYSFLVLHRRIHSGERPYVCTWDGCKKQFRRSDDYQRHYRVHTGVRPFPCEICGKSFKRSDHRLFHYRAIHNLQK